MSRFILVACVLVAFILLAAFHLPAQQAEVVYVEGTADIRESGGRTFEANFGDGLYSGDSVVTGYDGRVELEQADESVIQVAPDTVFSVREVGESGRPNTVYATEVGSAFFRFRTLVSREPRVVTPSSTAGVRGTAFTVFAGVDGSALYIVEEGRVDVSAAGRTVELGPGEGVEVRVGSEPGETFEVQRGSIDYSQWNADRLDAMRADPVGAIEGVARRMDEFVAEIGAIVPEYEANRQRLDRERETLERLEEEDGRDARSQYYRDTVFPLEVETSYQFLNIRYFALSALSLRRYVMTGIYIRVVPAWRTVLTDQEYRTFLTVYGRAAEKFEEEVVPYLVDADF